MSEARVDFRYLVMELSPWLLMGLGLACFAYVMVLDRRDRDRRFYGHADTRLVRVGRHAVPARLRPGDAGRPDGRRAQRLLALRQVSRFTEPQDPAFQRMNTSLAFDRRLWPQDVAQSRAHATMLAARGIIGDDDRDALLAGLDAVERELADGTFPFAPDDEDIHMAIERRLTEIAGPVGGKLHTARSRNDQVATDVALFTREAALGAVGEDRAR